MQKGPKTEPWVTPVQKQDFIYIALYVLKNF